MSHQIGGAVGVLLDLHDVGKRGIARLEAHQQEVAEANHRGQQIVEIMRDTAGQLADRLHLLRLGELDFQVLLLGDIDEMEHQPAIAALEPVEPPEKEDAGLVAQPFDADLDRTRRRRAFGRLDSLTVRSRRSSSLRLKLDQRLADQIARHRAEQFAEPHGSPLPASAVAVDQRDADRRVGEKPLEALARQAQRRLPLALRREVADDRMRAQARRPSR